MSEKPADQNDQKVAGVLELDPLAHTRVKPLNKAAEKKAENAPRILTVRQLLESAARRSRAEGKQEACTTGHYQLDAATGGIRPGKSWVFAAESSWGKSSWLIAVADENLRRGKRVLIVTSEDDEETYGSRLLARRSRIAAKRIRSGEYEAGESDLVDQVVAGAENLPVYLDARGKHCEWVAQQVDAIIERENIDLVAFDYLQEFSAARQQENHRLTVKYIAGTLRRVVKLRKRASIIMSQVTVDTNSKNEFPSRHMIRDCRDVANAAEVIIIGYEVSKAIMDGTGENAPVLVPVGGRAIFVDKVKDGPKGFAVAVNWHEETASFDPYLRPRAPGTAEEQEALDPSWKTRPRRETLDHGDDDGRYGA